MLNDEEFLMNEEFFKAFTAALMLLGLFSLATYYVLTTPEEIPIEASKLIILKPSRALHLGVEAELIIEAVSDGGVLDSSRDDLVEVSLSPNSHAQLGYSDRSRTIWHNSLIIKLEKGQCQIKFIDKHMERVHILVEWLEGKSLLGSNMIELYPGGPYIS